MSKLKIILKILTIFLIFSSGFSLGIYSNKEFLELKNQIQNKSQISTEIIKVINSNDNEKIRDKISLDKLGQVYDILKEKAVDQEKLDDNKHLEDSIIAGLVRSLDDPYSLYMTEKENKDFKEDLAGNFEGIGAELQMKDEMVTVVSPLKDSPAIKAGIRPQDIILKVDNKEINGWALTDVIKIIRGPKGEPVTLSILRKGESGLLDIKIVRDTIHVTSVKYELKNSTGTFKIGYISINQFGDSTIDEYIKAIKSAENDDIKGVILDLRFNGGGYLDGSIAIASPFLNNGDLITSVKSKNLSENKNAVYYNTKIKNLPMIVLINGGSASASEIVAGALRDNKKAILLGNTSFGKGTVQELVPLSGKSSLRVTTAKWYTPNGQNIHKVGINPDIEVKRDFEELGTGKDNQVDKAIETLTKGNLEDYLSKKESLTGNSVVKFDGSGNIISK